MSPPRISKSVLLDADAGRRRFRLRAPDPWSAVAIILAMTCFIREFGSILTSIGLLP